MNICQTCMDSQPTSGEFPTIIARPRVFCDPIWNSIQAEGMKQAEREPILKRILSKAVLERPSFGDGLAMLLANRLENNDRARDDFYRLLAQLFQDDDRIIEAARRDLLAIRANDPAVSTLLHPFLNFKGFLATQTYRAANSLWRNDRRALAQFLQGRASESFGVDIHPAATIGSGLFLDHGTGIVIGETAIVGDDVTILHGVTLGGTGKESGARHPIVESSVYIGAGAQLLGRIRIGTGSQIGASSVVLEDVKPHNTVVGVPAKPVQRADNNERQIA